MDINGLVLWPSISESRRSRSGLDVVQFVLVNSGFIMLRCGTVFGYEFGFYYA
jgi:hypothetical protein